MNIKHAHLILCGVVNWITNQTRVTDESNQAH
jgi:hypothetical protein